MDDNCSKDHYSVKNGTKDKPLDSVDSEKLDLNGERDKDNETKSLLPAIRGGLSKKSGKPKRKVQWNDKNGNKLADVKVFQPSDDSDSDDKDTDTCMCTIM